MTEIKRVTKWINVIGLPKGVLKFNQTLPDVADQQVGGDILELKTLTGSWRVRANCNYSRDTCPVKNDFEVCPVENYQRTQEDGLRPLGNGFSHILCGQTPSELENTRQAQNQAVTTTIIPV